jgi:hypothetical protein
MGFASDKKKIELGWPLLSATRHSELLTIG